jgi:small-conductance mechanosensitive channel
MICRLFGQGIAGAGRAALIVAALAFSGATTAPAQEPLMPPAPTATPAQPPSDPAAGIEALKAELLEIENAYKESAHTEDALVALMRRLAPLRDQLSERIGKLEPRLKAIEQRAAQFAPSKDKDATNAAEDPAIAAERQRLASRHTEVAGALQQTKLMANEAGNLDERIHRRRREVFNNRLFARSASLFDSAFWNDLLRAVPAEINGLAVMASSWSAYALANGGAGAGAALALLAALGITAWSLSRWRRRLTARPTPRRFDKALVAVVSMVSRTVKWPALVAGAVLVLHNFRLMPDSVAEIGFGLAMATLVAGFGRGVAAGLFAPGHPDRRVVALTDREAASYASHLTWAARFTGLALLANEIHRILGASVTSFVATGALQAFAILAVTVHLLWRIARARFGAAQLPQDQSIEDQADPEEAAGAQRAWLRALLWLCSIAIAIGLAAGYVGFAVFVGSRMLAAFAVGGAVYILMTIIDAALTDLLAAGTPGGRSVAAAFGVTQRGIDLVATLASALLRLVIVALAVVLALNASGVFTDDIFGAIQRLASDYDIGAIHVSPVAILSALACLIVGGLAVRASQRWMTINFLPRTGLEAGLQNSIVALSGYFALIIVLAISLGILGIDLQKIALIAGALSVGIGFGLQSVVSNFVSGLILLAERSIRVGDWVVVKNEEGFVRRISIRATEIETFDRATVIVPNQDFITGAVKNWTHSNTVGRVIVKVRVAFDTDLTRVRELLLEAAVKHPLVLPGTPGAYVIGFGDIGVDVELMCLIGNVSQGLTVRSELYIDVLCKLRDARIRIPAPIHEANVPALPAQVTRIA